ncbi:MAG: hypothetical protein Q9P90_01950 [candidate division KSB1 bacterium]|nr:hypothetical protein [candidate division KSB1 bacterium]
MEKKPIKRFLSNLGVFGFSSFIVMLFLYSAVKKIAQFDYFAYVLSNYPIYKYILVSFIASKYLAFAIAILEIAIVCAFILFKIKSAIILSLTTLILYAINLISLIVENTFFECGCALFYKFSNPNIALMFDSLLILIHFYILGMIANEKFNSLTKEFLTRLR